MPKKLLSVILITSLLFSLFSFSAGAAVSFEEWQAGWEDIKASAGYITLTPGEDETQMNFSWQASFFSTCEQLVIGKKADLSDATAVKAKRDFNLFGFE